MSQSNISCKYKWIGSPFNLNNFYYRGKSYFVLDKETNERIQVAFVDLGFKFALNPKLHNQEFFDFCAQTAPDIFTQLPIEIQTSEMQENIAKNTTQFDMLKYMNLEKLLMDCGKTKVEEICITLIKKYGNAICYLPDNFMYSKILDAAVIYHKSGLSKIALEYKTLERCILSVNIWGSSLKAVPKEFWNNEVEHLGEKIKLYELAIKVDGISLKLLPLELKTPTICETAVMSNSEAIVHVPPKYITKEFMQKLYDNGIKISSKNKKYIDECLKLYGENNGILDKNDPNFFTQIESSSLKESSNYNNIPLAILPKIINRKILTVLSARQINTLGKLFELYETPNFAKMFPRMSYAEINGTVNILKCQLFNNNPLIDFDEKITINFLMNKLGITSRTAHIIEACYRDKSIGYLITIVLFKDINLPNIVRIDDITHIDCINRELKTRLSNEAYDEIYEKLSIIVNYYQKRQASLKKSPITNLVQNELDKTIDNKKINNNQEIKNTDAEHIADILTEMAEINKIMTMLSSRIEALNITLQQLGISNKGVTKKHEK